MKHRKFEQTLVIIKPDGIQRGMIGEVVKRIERVGLKLVALKMVVPTTELVKKHYLTDPEWIEKVGKKSVDAYLSKGLKPFSIDPVEVGNRVLEKLLKYYTSGPVVVMVWQGMHAPQIVRKIVGSTEPLSSDVGTLRGDFVLDSYEVSDLDGRSIRNLIHASGNTDEANAEIPVWFDEKEIINYRLVAEQILYDVNLDGILE